MKNFEQLGIKKEFVKGLEDLNITIPSEIQTAVIPLLVNSKTDLIGQAQTGTGKTAAYGLPILQQVDSNRNEIQALILCPTRELGQQIAKQLFKFTKYSEKIFTEAVYGGSPIDKQISALSRPTHIIVATPGRLIDLVNKNVIDLSKVKTVVLDEADEMLSMGFQKELEEILGFLTTVENKWLFSATIPEALKTIIAKHISKDAPNIVINSKNVVNKNISHQFTVCEETEKFYLLLQFLKSQHKNRGMIFCKTKIAAQNLAKQLIAKNILADALHGDLLQKERDKVMRAFKNESLQILVATDIAARGIDIEGLSYVVHYQLPDKEEYYTHRSGRTARAGKTGTSLSLVTAKEKKMLKYFERALSIDFEQIR
ncbi:MAG: DEAD/DEAH box helicase [Bacteroidota bacterium]